MGPMEPKKIEFPPKDEYPTAVFAALPPDSILYSLIFENILSNSSCLTKDIEPFIKSFDFKKESSTFTRMSMIALPTHIKKRGCHVHFDDDQITCFLSSCDHCPC